MLAAGADGQAGVGMKVHYLFRWRHASAVRQICWNKRREHANTEVRLNESDAPLGSILHLPFVRFQS